VIVELAVGQWKWHMLSNFLRIALLKTSVVAIDLVLSELVQISS